MEMQYIIIVINILIYNYYIITYIISLIYIIIVINKVLSKYIGETFSLVKEIMVKTLLTISNKVFPGHIIFTNNIL